MSHSVNITKRVRTRKLKSGERVKQTRYVVSFRDPRTDKRRQFFFERHKDAQAKRNEVVSLLHNGEFLAPRKVPTVADAVRHWLEQREGEVKARTFVGYQQNVMRYVVGPLLMGTPDERRLYAETGKKPPGTTLKPMLGSIRLSHLKTAEIRAWHKLLQEKVGHYTADRAKMLLKAVFDMAEEDFDIRPPTMPRRIGRGRQKIKKQILNPEQIAVLLEAACSDTDGGIYYAFPFLTGTRISEQLGLLWEDVDFERNIIRIQRIQELNGDLTEITKTEAGTRDIPMCPQLRQMLLEWRVVCPRLCGEHYRVFPGPGRMTPWPQPRTGGGGALLYQNFRNRYWKPVFSRLRLPYVTPHAARHCFISTLQAQGIEVGLVAKLAGHANATVTLSHYTQAMRGGEDAILALEDAYSTDQRKISDSAGLPS